MKTPMLKHLLAAMLLAAVHAVAQAADATVLRLHNPPQASGIEIGDVLQRTVEIALAQPYQISRTALPAKGTRSDGIELVGLDIDSHERGNQTVYAITLSYQVFAAAVNPKVMQLPQQSFAVSGGAQALTVSIPAWGFWFSPLVAATDIAGAKANLQPSRPPLLIAAGPRRIKLGLFASLALVAAIALLYINADRRWLPFMGGPFARAHRQIKRLQANRGQHKPTQEKQALFYLHQAFNQTFGATLFAKNLQQFLAQHPQFSRLANDIQAFFETSNRALFGGAQHAASLQQLRALSKSLRDSERGV